MMLTSESLETTTSAAAVQRYPWYQPYPYPPYEQPDFVSVIDIVILVVVILTGVVGNLLIFATILTEKRLQNQSNALVLNIAFADLLITAFVLPVVVGNVVEKRSLLGPQACVLASCLVVVTCAVSILSLACISFNRYFFICRQQDYNRYFSKRNTAILIGSMWCFWIILVGVTSIWQPHYYNPDSLICIFDHQRSLFFTGFLMGFGIGLPVVITFICYYRILRKVQSSQRALQQHNKASIATVIPKKNADSEKMQRKKQRENRATAALFVAFMCFLVFWGPYGIAAVVYYFQRLPQYVIKYLSWLGMSNSCVNSIVYGAMNKNFSDGYARILMCCWRRVRFCKDGGTISPGPAESSPGTSAKQPRYQNVIPPVLAQNGQSS